MASAGTEAPLIGLNPHQTSQFASYYPLAFRISTLASLGVLAWAVVLQVLAKLIDTSVVLDVKLEITPATGSHYIHPSKLHPPVYGLAFLSLAWTSLGLVLYTFFGHAGDGAVGRLLPLAFLGAALTALLSPWDRLYRKERFMLLRSLRRVALEGFTASVPFCDVILADILTSYAKVLGDVWVTCGYVFNADTRESWGGLWGVPLITALPYIFRLRQCLAEAILTPSAGKSAMLSAHAQAAATRPRGARERHLLNALKYATAFPVIILSALQGGELDLLHSDHEHKESRQADMLVYTWISAVLLNSLYSFWWDVTNDWGLALLLPSAWKHVIRSAPMQPIAGRATPPSPSHALSKSSSRRGRLRPSLSGGIPKALPEEEILLDNGHRVGTPSHNHRSNFTLLRSSLLLSDPLIYCLAIVIDLLLRLTWSLKLSSHLHAIHEIEQGVFLLEALEVARRTMWLFLRIEWEAIRRNVKPGDAVTMPDDLPMEERYRDGVIDEESDKGELPLYVASDTEKSTLHWQPLALRDR